MFLGESLFPLSWETVAQRPASSKLRRLLPPLPVGAGWSLPRTRSGGEGLPGNRPRVTQGSLEGELGSLGRRPRPRALARLVPKAARPPKSLPLRPGRPGRRESPSRDRVDTYAGRVDTFGEIGGNSGHIWPETGHIWPETEHIRAKTEHLAANTVNTCAGRGMPRDGDRRSPQRQSERRHSRPDHTQPCLS